VQRYKKKRYGFFIVKKYLLFEFPVSGFQFPVSGFVTGDQ